MHDRVLGLRNKIVAHSDEDLMHFRVDLIEVEHREKQWFPHLQGYEPFLMSEEEHWKFDELIRGLIQAIATRVFEIAQESPERVEKYKRPVIEE